MNKEFYSSTSIDNLDHAKNFSNSILCNDMSLKNNISQNIRGVYRMNSLTGTKYVDNATTKENENIEMETQVIKMSTSPSLSALAGILTAKTKKTENELKNKLLNGTDNHKESNLHNKTQSKPVNEISSPNLIVFDNTDETINSNLEKQLSNFQFSSADQPDFLTTPKTEPSTPYVDVKPTFTNKNSQNVLSENNNQGVLVDEHDPLKCFPKELKNDVCRSDNSSALNNNNTQKQSGLGGLTPSKKKRTLFSFLKKRRPSTATSLNSTSLSESALSVSLGPTQNLTSEDPQKLTKKTYSNGNIFTIFTKSKDTAPKSSNLTNKDKINKFKKRQNSLPSYPVSSNYSSSDLTSNKVRQSSLILDKSSRKSSVYATCSTKVDNGAILFPKSLDIHEIESIVSLERSRSIKSSKRNSVASNKKSFSESLSVNAQNEGMFVTEASSIIISTPNFSKSPASSILKTGKFEPVELSPVYVETDSCLDLGLGISTGQDLISRDLSFTSFQEKLNQLAVDSDDNDESTKVPLQSLSTIISPVEDFEFMSDIVEFANIIDFGGDIGIDLDFGSDLQCLKNRSLNALGYQEGLEMETKTGFNFSFSGNSFNVNDETKNLPGNSLIINNSIKPVIIRKNENNKENIITTNKVDNQIHNTHNFIPGQKSNLHLASISVGHPIAKCNSPQDITAERTCYYQKDKINSCSRQEHVKHVKFSPRIVLFDTYTEDEYDRHPYIATCNQLTPQLAQMIKQELNELKSEMEIHEDSMCYTHFL